MGVVHPEYDVPGDRVLKTATKHEPVVAMIVGILREYRVRGIPEVVIDARITTFEVGQEITSKRTQSCRRSGFRLSVVHDN